MTGQSVYDKWLIIQKSGKTSFVEYLDEVIADAKMIGMNQGRDEGYKQCQHDDKVFNSYHGDRTLL